MSIHWITGKPGGGKSLYAMKLVIDELLHGNRCIVTNLPIKLEPWLNAQGDAMRGLRGYLALKHPEAKIDLTKRVRVISDDECKEFFLRRQHGLDLELIYEKGKGGKEKPEAFDTSKITEGIMYVIDECWKFFDARQWSDTGRPLLFYCAQHRKIGDDVIFVTQEAGQCDSALHRVSQDYSVITNHSKLKIFFFRQPDVFTVFLFPKVPNGSIKAMDTQIFRLDKRGIAQTYDTSAGVGIIGRQSADLGARKKGLAIWWLIAAVIIAGAIMVFIPRLMGMGLSKAFSPSKPARIARPTNAAPAQVQPPAVTNGVFGASRTNQVSSSSPGETTPRQTKLDEPVISQDKESVYLTGYARDRGKLFIYLSDGRMLTERSADLKYVGDEYVVVGSNVYRFKPLAVQEPEGRGETRPARSGFTTGR